MTPISNEQLQNELQQARERIRQLEDEKEFYRRNFVNHLNASFDPSEWDNLTEADFPLTIDDLLEAIGVDKAEIGRAHV